MFKVYKATVVAMAVAIGASSALAAGSHGGVIYFTGAIVEAGFRVQATPQVSAAGEGLQARASASGHQVVLSFRSAAVRVVPVDVSVEARAASSLNPLRVGDARSKADVLAKYGGFKASLLTANNGTLTLSRAPGVEPALAVVTLSYQ
ncbi:MULTISPECIES: hypothetical protein [Ralstonia]|jgi:hypothetical protein|uniref:Uncharacterized protein n=1 Tax=Ralstonia pickettii OR214 TaxID=1264675 RepID=R0CS92_RALPI|nr:MULTISPECIES: hypothetical protein [Ralstonia]MBE3035257.1 hypothetical protein [Actinomycetota bacterium]MEA3267618.1 hypothetical protein [Pseudomonadota bacterium]ENZ79446.1 hypothetical protein OR214_01019 [Ralstonia pickettii OR214]MBL4776258.1 hypothetical protein [Ralstonia sp.]MCM3580288.1 hypothetical protein [Ralstonia pickettii]